MRSCCHKIENHKSWDCGCSGWWSDCQSCHIAAECSVCGTLISGKVIDDARKRLVRATQRAAMETGWTPSARQRLAKQVRDSGLAPSARAGHDFIVDHGGYDLTEKFLASVGPIAKWSNR